MNSRVAASERLVERIDAIVLDGVSDPERLAELGRLGAQLVIQRTIEDEVAAFLGRARYGREPDARGWRNGVRPRRIQTGEGPLTVEVPQVRGSLVRFVSSVIPDLRGIIRTQGVHESGATPYQPARKPLRALGTRDDITCDERRSARHRRSLDPAQSRIREPSP